MSRAIMSPIMKQSLVLLCGLLCDEAFWTDIPQRLSSVADVSVVSFRGFSSIQAMAEHVLAVAPERFAIAGHSMGGRVALEVIRTASRRITALALLNTGVHAVRDGEPQSRAHLLRVAYERGMLALAAEWLAPLMGSGMARAAGLMPPLTAMVERWTADAYADPINTMLHRPQALTGLPTSWGPTPPFSGRDDPS